MKKIVLATLILTMVTVSVLKGQSEGKVIRLGVIGLDTSHVTAFTKLINNPKNKTGCRVVAAYPGGSPDIPASANRLERFTNKMRDHLKVEIVSSIEELCQKVDGVLLESVDGRPHLKQVRPVIAAGKPVFIDKPMAASLADVMEIFQLAKENNVPCWSSSCRRYSPYILGLCDNEEVGEIVGCCAYNGCSIEKHHPDLYWYGVHGVEMLFTIMGPGCVSISRTHTPGTDVVIGIWNDGRIGTYRGRRLGRGNGAVVFGLKGTAHTNEFGGYGPLCDEIRKFFRTGKAPVPAEVTIEIFAFMTAAEESKKAGGATVSIASVIEKARKKNELRRAQRK